MNAFQPLGSSREGSAGAADGALHVTRYEPADRERWDRFVGASKNGMFLFHRAYMDYHRDRFVDHSLLVWSGKPELVALLPGNSDGKRFVSHAGLTYGGFITGASMKQPKMIETFEAALGYLKAQGYESIVYKTIPHIFHAAPAEEDRYALFLSNAGFVRRGVLAVVDRQHRLPLQERRRRSHERATRRGLVVRETGDLRGYWAVVAAVLQSRHGVKPVHSLEEIVDLQARFPANIRLFGCFAQDEMIAGVLIFESERVAHVQYVASAEAGRESGALDLVFQHLLSEVYRDKPFFDFGTSDESDGRILNQGLIDQKEGFGARVVVHDHHAIDLAAWRPGQIRAALGRVGSDSSASGP